MEDTRETVVCEECHQVTPMTKKDNHRGLYGVTTYFTCKHCNARNRRYRKFEEEGK